MSLDSVLEILKERGLSISVDAEGRPRAIGRKEEVTDAVKEVLSVYRAEIIERFKPKMPRRIVLLDGNEGVVKVLEECEAKGHHERIRKHAERHPGQAIAGEWRQTFDGREQWTRFITLNAPRGSEQGAVAAPESAEVSDAP